VDLEESMEFVEPEASGPAEESADEGVTDEETDLGVDWETVPSPRFCDIPSQVGPSDTHLVHGSLVPAEGHAGGGVSWDSPGGGDLVSHGCVFCDLVSHGCVFCDLVSHGVSWLCVL